MANFAQAAAEIKMTITQNHIAELLALTISIVCWKYINKSSFRWLPFFLLFILMIELIGNYFHSIPYANIILYNFSIPLEYLFYLFLFYLNGNKKLKQFSKGAMIVLVLVALYFIFSLPMKKFHNYVLAFGQVTVIISSCLYLFERFTNTEEESLLSIPFFWLSSGYLLFNLGELAFTILYPLIKKNGWDKTDDIFNAVNNNLLLLLYLSYIIAILLHRKYKYKYAQ